MRVAFLFSILPRILKEGDVARKAAFITTKNSQFDRSPLRYGPLNNA